MRALLPAFLIALVSLPVQASPAGYELYLLACDSTRDCRRVATVTLGSDGLVEAPATPGIAVRIVPLTTPRDAASYRLHVNLEPERLLANGGGPISGPVSLQFESNGLRQNYFAPIATFTSDSTIYQLWGKLIAPPLAEKNLASR
ncbi:MAG: hypothetical protein CVU18_15475 [Betaproteobacteria bacterium HGW-Betaproteobacteria-12]|nr:MAG: hypothetical protein CVU18_15475 [Betaproteobacteria bacterium HGW-Betaproteobacteria-12]